MNNITHNYETLNTLKSVTDLNQLYKLYLDTQKAYGFYPLNFEAWKHQRLEANKRSLYPIKYN